MNSIFGGLLLCLSATFFFAQSKKEIKRDGLAAFTSGDFVTAKTHYLKLEEKGEKTWETYTILGDCEFQTGNPDEALIYYRKARDKNPIYPGIHLRVATVLRQQKKFDQAISSFRTMMITNPNNPQVYNMIASTYYDKGEYENALDEIEIMIKLGGENLDSSYGRAMSYIKLDRIVEACTELEKADKFDKNNDLKEIDLMTAQHCQK